MNSLGAVIMQLKSPIVAASNAPLQFYLDAGSTIYDFFVSVLVWAHTHARAMSEGGRLSWCCSRLAACGYRGWLPSSPCRTALQSWFEAEGWEFFTNIPLRFAFPCIWACIWDDRRRAWLSCAWKRSNRNIVELAALERESVPILFPTATPCNGHQRGLSGRACAGTLPRQESSLFAACRAGRPHFYDPGWCDRPPPPTGTVCGGVSMIGNGGGAVHCKCVKR